MDKDKLLEAKEIFLKYGGSHFYMEREGEYENYKKFLISESQEKLWLNEYQNELLLKIANEDFASDYFIEITDALKRSKDGTCFSKLLDWVKEKETRLDTFSKVLMCEGILDVIESFKRAETENSQMINEARILVLDILNNSLNKPVIIASYYRDTDYLNDVINEDKIISRIKKLIKKCN